MGINRPGIEFFGPMEKPAALPRRALRRHCFHRWRAGRRCSSPTVPRPPDRSWLSPPGPEVVGAGRRGRSRCAAAYCDRQIEQARAWRSLSRTPHRCGFSGGSNSRVWLQFRFGVTNGRRAMSAMGPIIHDKRTSRCSDLQVPLVPQPGSCSGKQSLLDHLVRPAQLFETSSSPGVTRPGVTAGRY